MERTAIPKRSDQVRVRGQDGGLAVFHIETADYFVLNGTGARIWQLCDGTCTVQSIAEALAKEFPDNPGADELLADVMEYLEAMRQRNLMAWPGESQNA